VAEDDRVPTLAQELEGACEGVGGGDAGVGFDIPSLALCESLLFY